MLIAEMTCEGLSLIAIATPSVLSLSLSLSAPRFSALIRVHTKGVVRQPDLLRRVLRRFSRSVLRRGLALGFSGRKGSEKGSWKTF